MAARYCTTCGNKLGSDDRFCPNCGTPVHQAAYVPTPEADVTVPPPPAEMNPSLNLSRGGVFRKIAALPTWAKALVVLVVLVVLGMSILLSPLVMVLAFLVLIVAVLALVIQLLRRASARRWGIIAVMSLIVLLVFTGISNALYFGGNSEQTSSPESKRETRQAAPEETTTIPTDKEEAASEEDEDQGRYDAVATVERVVDGDTVEVEPAVDGEEEVRLIGIDTPETKDPDEGVEPYGNEASKFAVSALEGEEVELEFDAEKKDQYGRLLAYVYPLGEKMFNEDLVSGGYAQVYTVSPNTRYEDRFEAAQKEARDANVGIWGLSEDEQCELADRGNDIGEGTPACQPKPEPAPEPDPIPEPENELAGLGQVVTMTRAVDGDTIEISPMVDGRTDVRLIGIDTPEISSDCGKQPLADAAERYTAGHTGEKVALEFDEERIDPYDRLLAYVYLPSGSMLNEELVSKGLAQVATFPPNTRYESKFIQAQDAASIYARGIWGLDYEESLLLEDRGNGIGGGCEAQPEPPATATATAPATAAATAEAGGAGLPPLPADGDYDCSHFGSQAQAQQVFNSDPSDPHGLDGSPEDGIACESLP